MQGTQGQFKFLPWRTTDFIYSVLAEELGFVACWSHAGLYLLVIVRALDAAKLPRTGFGAYLVVGLVSGFSFQGDLQHHTCRPALRRSRDGRLPLMSYGGVVDDRDIGEFRPHPERQDAAFTN